MENAADALKMAFAVFVFIIALSIVFSLISQAKQTADVVLERSDKTNYYDWIESNFADGRTVGIDTVISTLKNYKNQNIYVIIKEGNDKKEFNYSSSSDLVDEYIEKHAEKNYTFKETVKEITIGGRYKVAEDGTRITIEQGQTRTYIIYEKIKEED